MAIAKTFNRTFEEKSFILLGKAAFIAYAVIENGQSEEAAIKKWRADKASPIIYRRTENGIFKIAMQQATRFLQQIGQETANIVRNAVPEGGDGRAIMNAPPQMQLPQGSASDKLFRGIAESKKEVS